MRRVRVRWQTTETFEAVLDVPDDAVDGLWDGDNGTLVELEDGGALDDTGEATYQETEREIESVDVIGED